MSDHPYSSLPDKAFWRRSVASIPPGAVDPVDIFTLRIDRDTKIGTAGSCFAQHIARHLEQSGFSYYVAETGHPILPAALRKAHNYGIFSARYGNIYTARQLVQLIERAYDRFTPLEDAWIEADGSVRDPFRPTVQPRGFVSIAEMRADRRQHLAFVRALFKSLNVFVFTLGLTECWESRVDGAVFPLCPGVDGGTFNPEKYAFRNQDATEVIGDMSQFIDALRQVNGNAEIVLTVSPVPLVASAEPGAHVLSATTYSKSVLRVAVEILRQRYPFVHYFPSFEIITGAFNRGRYFGGDLRSVTEEGVSHVMRLFLRHVTGKATDLPVTPAASPVEENDFLSRGQALIDVECDETALDR